MTWQYVLWLSLFVLFVGCALWLADAIDEASRETDHWLESMYDD